MRKGELDLAVVFRKTFRRVLCMGEVAVQLLSNSSDPNRGSISTTCGSYHRQISAGANRLRQIPFQIQTENRMIYNPADEIILHVRAWHHGTGADDYLYHHDISLHSYLKRRRDHGGLLASPLKQGTMIFAKTIPYMIISFVDFLIILILITLSWVCLSTATAAVALLITLIYIILTLTYGLTVSTLVDKQVNAVIVSAITAMIPVLMLSGMIFPIDNMPRVLQAFSSIIPARWFIEAVRKVMIQGQGFLMIGKELFIMTGMTLFLLGITIAKTKKRLD